MNRNKLLLLSVIMLLPSCANAPQEEYTLQYEKQVIELPGVSNARGLGGYLIGNKKAEPIKRWLAAVGAERIDQMQDPEKSIEQAIADYRRLGYSEQWINQRIKTIEIRKKLTDEL